MATAVSSELEAIRRLARSALSALERSRQRIDDLNVYPVPDGDTGTNMTLTARAVVDALDASSAGERRELAREITRAALMGARGNSGVILSQIVRGFADGLGDADPVDSGALARAFRSASDAAYRAVRTPVEGTMLTVIGALAEAAANSAREARGVGEVLVDIVRSGDEAVARTREQLDVLREAGVVDAGAAGLVELVRGLAAGVSGEELPEVPPGPELAFDAIHQELSRFRYCTTFVVEGDGLDIDALEGEFERLGDSLLVVGDTSALKVHVHTDDPGTALRIGTTVGLVDAVEIANMHRQTTERTERLLQAVPDVPPAASEVVAVVAGDGNHRLFRSLGATQLVEGGQSMNPSAADLVAAIEAAGTQGVVLLPNNPNVLMSAEQAAELASKDVRVVASDSIPAGLAAMVAYDPSRTAADNAREMAEAVESIGTGAVTIASRAAEVDGIGVEAGDYLGLVGKRAIAAGSGFDDVARAVVEHLLAEPRDVLTLLTGEGAPALDGLLEELRRGRPELELEVHDGGQPHYPLLVSAE